MSAKVVRIDGMRLVARNRLVEQHRDLVPLIAKHLGRRLPSCFDLDDLIDAGTQGLMKARDRYDPSNHNATPFRDFAKHYIRGFMLDSIRRRHWAEATHPPLQFRGAEPKDTSSPDLLEEPHNTPDLVGELAMQHAIDVLRRELEYLPEPGRSIVRLYYLEGMRLPDVARAAEVSESRVAQLRNEAIRELKRRLSWHGLRAA